MNNYRVVKPLIDVRDYCGFKLRFRDGFADRFVLRDVLKRDNAYARLAPNAKTVIDIGAHIGMFSLAAVNLGAEKVYAFEPEESNYELLCHNIKINGLENRVVCVNKGVGFPGETKLFIHPTNSGGSSTLIEINKDLNQQNYQTVEIISIHDVFRDYKIEHCDLVKIDCEGNEKDIINDLDDGLARKIDQLSIEFHDIELVNKLILRLQKWYRARCVNPGKYGNSWIFN